MISVLASMAVLLTGIGLAKIHRTHPAPAHELGSEVRAAIREGDALVDMSREHAQVEAALADHEQAGSIVKRMEAMLRYGAISRADYDRAKAEFEQTAVRVDEIRATLGRKAIAARLPN